MEQELKTRQQRRAEQREANKLASRKLNTPPKCRCGAKMVEKTHLRGWIFSCENPGCIY